MNQYNNHIGEINKMNCGMTAKIIAYRNNHDLDIEFEDGSIVTNKTYHNFKEGKISTKSLNAITRIGETRTMNCGLNATIITYNSAHDMSVQFEDGTIVTHKYYTDFVMGLIGHPNIPSSHYLVSPFRSNINHKPIPRNKPSHEELSEWSKKGKAVINAKYKNARTGETNYARNGQLMTIIEYNGYKDVSIQFEDGTIVLNQRYEKFKKGEVVNPNNKIIAHTSINEYTMLYYLSKYGFSKFNQGTLKHLGFGRMELDAFNKDIMMAVEYDGCVHKFRHNTDIKKDTACQQAGIELIRIRDNMDEVGYGSKTYKLINSEPFSKEYEIILSDICQYISDKANIPMIQVDFSKDMDTIISNYDKEYINSHIGEVYYDSSGEKAIIIHYVSAHNVTVRFEDGTKKVYQYCNLLNGQFNKIGRQILKKDHVGEKRMMKSGVEATIIKYNNCKDIDVALSNGDVLFNKRYEAFIRGEINPSKTKEHREQRLHEKKLMKCGLYAEIIEYINSSYVTIAFENGETVSNKAYSDFKNGSLLPPSLNKYLVKKGLYGKSRIGEEKVMTCGLKAKIIQYRCYNDIDVMFEDGFVNCHKTYQNFKLGNISHKIA